MKLDGGTLVKPQVLKWTNLQGKETLVEIALKEGKKREIKKVFNSIGYRVLGLKRISFNGVKLGDLKEGRWRRLTAEEIRRLKEEVGLRDEGVDNSN